MKTDIYKWLKIDKFSVYMCASGILLLIKILVERFVTGYTYLGIVRSVAKGTPLFNIYLYIMIATAVFLLLGRKTIGLVVSLLLYLFYMIVAIIQWFNVYDFIKIEAYAVLITIIVIDYLQPQNKNRLLHVLCVIPSILMASSIVYKIISARIYMYFKAASLNLLCDIIEFAVIFAIGLHYYHKCGVYNS